VSYTHEFLASRAGTDQPRATREIGRLLEEGVVKVDKSQHLIIVLDPDRLIEER
jgi:CRP-like cAMP-binding protein